MARDGSGNMSVPNADFTGGTTISSSEMDANFADVVAEITNSIAADGQTTPTANLSMGGYKHTGLGAGSAATDSANLGQVQAQAYIWCGTAGGSKNALTLTPSPAITAYAAGQKFRAVIGGTSSDDAVTIAISGIAGTKAVQIDGAACSSTAYLETGKLYDFDYDGTQFQATRLSPDIQNLPYMSTTLPQLGGMLDVNGQSFGDGTLELLKFSETASAVNEITIANAATGNAPALDATGDDTNIDLKLGAKGTGLVKPTSGAGTVSVNLGNLNSATTLHIYSGNIQHATMTGSFTLTAPDDGDEGYLELELTVNATGGYTLTLSGFNEISGTADMTANAVNLLRVSKLNTNTYLEITQAV